MKNNTQFLLLYSISFFLSVLVTFSIIPTVKAYTLSVNDDTFIDLLDTDANFGTNPALIVTDIVDKKSGERRIFLKFDTSIIPEKLVLNKAYLKLWIDKVHYPDVIGKTGVIDIYLILPDQKPWDENTLTAKSAPKLSEKPVETIIVDKAYEGKFYSKDITKIVGGWLKEPKSNSGIALVPSKISASIDSKENSQTSHPPEIEIINEGVPGPAGADGRDGINGTDGQDGTNGTDGTDGQDGTNGTNGTNGQDGTNGTNGTDGQDGTNGTNGTDGQDGVDGKDGFDLTLELCELYSLTSQAIPAVCDTLCGNGTQESWEECDDGNTDDGDGCSSTCLEEIIEVEDKIIFVTSEQYQGNLGGLTGADAKCDALATNASLPEGNYMAWLSDSTTSAAGRINPTGASGTVRYVLPDDNKTVVAESWDGLVSGTLLAPIDVDEKKNNEIDSTVWTNTNKDGGIYSTAVIDHCKNWTCFGLSCGDTNTEWDGVFGLSISKDASWTESSIKDCQSPSGRLYCIQL